LFELIATAKPGHTAQEMEAMVDSELTRLATEGPTEQELSSAKNAIWSGIIMSLEHLGGFGGVANRLNLYNQHVKDPDYLNKDPPIGAVTAEGVKRSPPSSSRRTSVVVYGIPGDKVLAAEPPPEPVAPASASQVESREPWRNDPPKAWAVSNAPLPSAKKFELSNGLAVYLVESHNLPVVAAHLVVRSGSAADPAGLPGLAGFTSAMLDEGTSKRDALGIARELSLGASLSTGSSNDGSYISCKSLKQNATPALGIMSDVVLNAAFPESEVDRIRNDRLTAMVQQRDSPFQTAVRVMTINLYGSDNPYGHVQLGTEEAVKAIQRNDLVSFYRSSYGRRTRRWCSPAISPEAEARKLAADTLVRGRGARGAEARRGKSFGRARADRHKPGSPQTAVLAA
jgi:zinc protease